VVAKINKEKYPFFSFIRDVWGFLDGHRVSFAFFYSLRILAGLGDFLIIFLLGLVVDFFANYAPGDSLTRFYQIVIITGVLSVFIIWVRLSSKFYVSKIGAKVRRRVRELSMSKLMDLELEWHEKEDAGSKIQKINEGSKLIYGFIANFLVNIGAEFIIGVFGGVILFIFLGWKYALFAFIYISIYVLAERYYTKRITKWTIQLSKILEKVSGKIHESASNVLSVKSLGLRKKFENFTRNNEKEYYKIWYGKQKAVVGRNLVVRSIAAIGYALFILLVGFDFILGAITLGAILIYIGYFNRMRASLNQLSEVIGTYINTKVSTQRLMTILGEDIFDRESGDLLEISKNWKVVNFENIGFSYKGNKVLDNFNLKIKRGEKIGIVGRSGCGKSTLTKLLLGLYKIDEGRITIDGVDINKFKYSSITSTITPVLQDSEMFNMTLGENISISSIRKKTDLLDKSIKVSNLNEFVKNFPLGLNTLIGEKGYKVSGGERQRIGIARAVYRNSPMLLLDEATSALDSETEKKIQENLENELGDKTLMIIAHRLSTLKKVDKIYYMDRGKIVEGGTFSELIKLKGKFYGLYRLQNRKR
tara:strand:+ start:1547 stop:3316 length:1770 start_codon:yes stop_codon:yes gene_type:complete